MSSDLAIRVEGVGKRYRLGETHGVARYRSLREDVAGLFTKGKGNGASVASEFWALRDVSFEVNAGETVGIIGRNGAGKSTMLKILARITPPTIGRGTTSGRVGSLLEVGTGFHPELTGRENIMLSAAVMGMRRPEVLSRFDEIVEFSGLSTFLDTPVKRYSSGMYMRLAFSVAAHLEPEILLVDEVLAVGDADFQKRCLGRMEELSGAGRTVLFVSHSMPSVLRLCPRVILLDTGRVLEDGASSRVIDAYMNSGAYSTAERRWETPDSAPGDAMVRLKSVVVRNDVGEVSSEIEITRGGSVEIEYWALGETDASSRLNGMLRFANDAGVELFVSGDFNNREWRETPRRPGVVRSTCRIPGDFLAEGRVTVAAQITSFTPVIDHVWERDVVMFQVVDRSSGDGVRGDYTRDWPGAIRPMLEWHVEVTDPPH